MDSVLILHLETSSKNCSVAISSQGKLVDCYEESEDKYIHGEKLTVFIQKLLKNNFLELKDIHAISISIGPGSYTGLRIGLSTAKAMCFSLQIPLISLNSLNLFLHADRTEEINRIAMIDARRMEVYALGKSIEGNEIVKTDSYILDEHSFDFLEPFMVVGDSHEKLKKIWSKRKAVFFSDIQMLSASFQCDLAYKKYIALDRFDLEKITPLYIKSFQNQN